jgi:hypothetical protein
MRGCVLFSLVSTAWGSIINFDAKFESLKMEIFSEGPMFTTLDSPFRQTGKKSEIVVDLSWMPLRAGDAHTIGIVFTTSAALTGAEGLPQRVLECAKDHSTDAYEAHFFNDVGGIQVSYEVKTRSVGKDFPRMLLFVCPCAQTTVGVAAKDPNRCWNSDTSNKKGVSFRGQISFANGYGYLAAKQFGYLPFYAVMVVTYFSLLIVYLILCLVFRHHLTGLNYATLALAIIGMVECALYFALYLWKNATGIPTWPPTPLQWVAAFTGVLKRDISRLLLLVVALGYGVTKPKLPNKTVAAIAILGVLFFFISIWKDIARDGIYIESSIDEHKILTINECALLVVDVAMLAWSLLALMDTQQSLFASKQEAKLRMYNALIGVMLAFTVVWGLFEAYRIAVVKGVLVLNWHFMWILNSFWHVSSFAILATIAFVWRPTKKSEQLSYWTQIAAFEDTSEEDEISIIEMEEED